MEIARVDVSDLRIFESVARLRNMNRAAEELNTVQSNVTARIRQLEAELDVRLFDRHSRGVNPTSAGLRLLPYAVKAMSLIADARKAVADDGTPVGPLIIGALETALAFRLSRGVAAFARAHPGVDLTIKTGTTAELVELVLDYGVEGAFVCGPVNHPELEETACFLEEMAIISSPAVERLDTVLSNPNLKQIVLRAGCSYRQRLEDILARRGVVGTKTLEFATLEAILSAVAAGVGISLLPLRMIGTTWPADRVRAHRLPREESDVETVFIRRRDAYLSSALAVFLHQVTTADANDAA